MLQKFIKWILSQAISLCVKHIFTIIISVVCGGTMSILAYLDNIPLFYSILGILFFLCLCISLGEYLISLFQSKINLPEIFTNTNETSCFLDIAQSISKYYKIEPSRMHFLLLQGFWNGYFNKIKIECLSLFPFLLKKTDNRLFFLIILHDLLTRKEFIWHYLDEVPPVYSWELKDGSTEYDIRPILIVPSKNTNMWTLQNCSKAFLKLSEQPIEHHTEDIWPQYAKSPLIQAGFYKFKISKKELNYFLRKEKITLESR